MCSCDVCAIIVDNEGIDGDVLTVRLRVLKSSEVYFVMANNFLLASVVNSSPFGPRKRMDETPFDEMDEEERTKEQAGRVGEKVETH